MFTALEYIFTDLEPMFTARKHNFSRCKDTSFFRITQDNNILYSMSNKESLRDDNFGGDGNRKEKSVMWNKKRLNRVGENIFVFPLLDLILHLNVEIIVTERLHLSGFKVCRLSDMTPTPRRMP